MQEGEKKKLTSSLLYFFIFLLYFFKQFGTEMFQSIKPTDYLKHLERYYSFQHSKDVLNDEELIGNIGSVPISTDRNHSTLMS